jgi:hypothetical protein
MTCACCRVGFDKLLLEVAALIADIGEQRL